MNVLQLNTIITAITNHLYAELSEKQFDCLTIFLSELSKNMFSMALLRKVCEREKNKKQE